MLSYLSKRKDSTTHLRVSGNKLQSFVVIPLQTKGFYNQFGILRHRPLKLSCHTSPNERILQLRLGVQGMWCNKLSYLSKRKDSTTRWQHLKPKMSSKLSYLSKRKDSTTLLFSMLYKKHWNIVYTYPLDYHWTILLKFYLRKYTLYSIPKHDNWAFKSFKKHW